ncbi:MAG: D-2-hydroxyacid dehydrogenase family protein [Candidatus Korobacteraceae bacterium]|jgi:phosphoglycerate dehydrogenase-like enzyme
MRLAILDDYQHAALTLADWDSLKPAVTVQAFYDTLTSEDALAERLRDFEIIVAMRERTKFPRTLIERLPKLKLLVTTGWRNVAIDQKATAERGIPVCGTHMLHATTAELTWALILALARNIVRENESLRQGRWQSTLGVALQGKVLGTAGLGDLGSKVAGIGKAFGMKVIAWSQNLTPERAASVGAELVTKEELFRRADFLTIHLVLSQRTRGLITAAELSLMKPTAYLINTSRGPIVDEQALFTILKNHKIAGAAIDVYSQEPIPADHPFLSLGNVLLTPHLGYVTADSLSNAYGEAVEDVRAFLAGKPIRVLGTTW